MATFHPQVFQGFFRVPNVIHRVVWSCRYYGILMTGLCVAVRIFSRLGWDLGSSPRFLAFKDRAIDRRFRMSTVGVVRPDDLDVASDQREHAIQYQPTASLDLAIVLDELADRTDLSEYSFVDFGSGRGRVICLASEFPFKATVGVEFSEKLHEDACRNVASFKSPRQRCGKIEPLCMDATEYSISDGPVVLFFFNPFDDVIMSQVLENIHQSWSDSRRDIVCIYHNPVHRALFDDSEFLNEVQDLPVEHEQWTIFRSGVISESVESTEASQPERLLQTC